MPTPTGSPSTFGGIGTLEWAPTNGPDDLSPTWDDLTPYLETVDDGSPVSISRGRQSEFDLIEAAQLSCVLKNADGRFTYGYTGGPYGSNWAPAKQIRYRETIGDRTFVHFTGNIQFPDIADWQPIGMQYVQLSALDRLARLGRGRRFVSTLSEYIKFNGGTSLVLFAPLNDFPYYRDMIGGLSRDVSSAAFGYGSPGVVLSDGTGPLALADDLPSVAQFTALTGAGRVEFIRYLPTVAVAVGQVITVVAWVKLDALCQVFTFGTTDAGPPGSHSSVTVDATSGVWTATMGSTSFSGTITSTAKAVVGEVVCVGARFGYNPAVFELWVNGGQFIGSLSGSPPASATTSNFTTLAGFTGSICDMQMYVDTAAAWDFTSFTAQRNAGLSGLEQQTTGARISTLLDYAGVPRYGRAIDTGVTNMQVAALAGQDPLSAIRNAANTEWGRFFMDGNNRPVFHDRAHVYNV